MRSNDKYQDYESKRHNIGNEDFANLSNSIPSMLFCILAMVGKKSQRFSGFAGSLFYTVLIGSIIQIISCKVPFGLTGKQQKGSEPKEILVWPPPPDTPRIQFLTAISNSQSVTIPRSKFARYFLGKDAVKQFSKPYGIHVRKGKIYICDTGIGGLVIIDLEKRTFRYFVPRGMGQLMTPINCFVDEKGFLYVADAARRQVVIFDNDKKFVACLGDTAKFKPTDVFVSDNKIWVANIRNNRIQVYSNDSLRKFLYSFPDSADGSESLLYSPTNIYVAKEKVFVSDIGGFNVKIYTHDGKYLQTVGGYGKYPGLFSRNKGIAVDRENILYVVDAGFQNVQMFNDKGQLLMFFGGGYEGRGYMWLPAKVALDYENLDYFRKYVAPGFDLKHLIFVTNQYGPDRINVYGFIQHPPQPATGQSSKPLSDSLTYSAERKPVRLFGQVYKRIPGDVHSEAELMLVNDDGTLLSMTKSDSAGNFTLDNLPVRNNYTIKLKNDTANVKFRIPDDKNSLCYVLEKDKTGMFHFEKLGWQDTKMELPSFYDTLLIALSQTNANQQKPKKLSGQIIGHIPGTLKRNMEIYALNESREIIGVANVYENGNFAFKKLPPYKNYLFVIKDKNEVPVPDINTVFIGNFADKEIRSVGKNTDGYFRFKYLPFQELALYALDEQKDTLVFTQLNKDGLFVFEMLPEDTGLTFLLSGVANSEQIEDISVIVNGRMRLLKKGEENKYRFVKLPAETARLFLMNAKGDTLQTAMVNENGFFEFKNELVYESEYLFRLDAPNIESIDEIQVIYTDEQGKEKIITPLKGTGGYFSYKKLPVPEAKLYMMNDRHDTLEAAAIDEDGYFLFRKLMPAGNCLFLLDSKDTVLWRDLTIHFAEEGGNMLEITAIRETGNLYQYKPLVRGDFANNDLTEEPYMPVHLKKIEEKILSSASTHLEFNLGESVIQVPSYSYIEGVNHLLLKNPTWNLVLSGHTDNIGSDEFNMGLSKRRAEAVKRALVKRSIPADRIFTKYYGESMPVADNATPEGRKKNRRVEMAIVRNAAQQTGIKPGREIAQDWKTSIISAGMHDIVFTIQVMTSGEPLALTPLNFNGLENIEELMEGGEHKYVAGISYDYEYASVVLLNEMRNAGFKDAAVIALQNGKRIPVEQAKNLIEK